MKLSLNPAHLRRYKDIGLLFLKYGSSDFAKEFELEEAFDKEPAAIPTHAPLPEELANDLEKMGPTFIKLSQSLSSRADLFAGPDVISDFRISRPGHPLFSWDCQRRRMAGLEHPD